MTTVLEALGRDAAAAQDFFSGDPAMLKRYLTERATDDGGVALGKALEAAMLTFRDHDGSPDHPSRGYLSAKLASEFVHLEAQRIEAGDPPESLVPAVTTGRILAGYIADINRTATGFHDLTVPGVIDEDNPSVPGREPWGAVFNKQELRRVMQGAFADDKAFASVLAAQTAFTGLLTDYGAAEMAASGSERFLPMQSESVLPSA